MEAAAERGENGTVKNGPPQPEPKDADFETAIKASGFGKFNILLIILILPCTCCQVFEANNMSYVLPIAQCDLNLTLDGKGQLNAISFAGMIASSFFWGYLSDTFGRRRIMTYGYVLHWITMLIAAVSQNFSMLLTAKFFGGFVVNGPTSATVSMLPEFHSSRYRARIQLTRGILVTLCTIILPLIAWAVLPRPWNFNLFGFLDLHSWNFFLLINSLPPLMSFLLLRFVPESPKFLMTAGKNEEALNVFKKIYTINTGNPAESYPYKTLVDEKWKHKPQITENVKPEEDKKRNPIMQFLVRIKPLFIPPLVFRVILACSNSFLLMMSANTLKFWQPQLLQAINDYKSLNDGSSSNMCNMLEVIIPKNTTIVSEECTVNYDNASVYINSIIISASQLLTFFVAGTVVEKMGRKLLLGTMAITAAACSTSVYFAGNSDLLVALFAIFISTTAIARNISATVTLEMFPTTIRNSAMSLHMMSARTGSVIGNLIFPSLLLAGCLPPFLFIGLSAFGSACLAMFFPNTEGKALK